MKKCVAIIGSFQKYYNDVVSLIDFLTDQGLFVISPKRSAVVNKIDDFVILRTDNKEFTPVEIQMITTEKILNADVIYVYNPDGYVGKTTCYELGFFLSRFFPIYFYTTPIDLPMPVSKKQILPPEAFAELVKNERYAPISNYNFKSSAAEDSFKWVFKEYIDETPVNGISHKLVICGSMTFYNQMVECRDYLEQCGVECIIPKEENDLIKGMNPKQFSLFKRRVSSAYLKKIRDKNTIAVLAFNQPKNQKKNYIGANTLVEIAMAFTWGRKIFILNDFYEPLKDELSAWDCIPLNGNLKKLIKLYHEIIKEKTAENNNIDQPIMRLFEP